MSTFVEFHALRAFPPSNLNRDDLGSPKTSVFGGSRRLRISSQCLKRTWRTSSHFRGAFADEQLGIRTDRLPGQVLEALGRDLDEGARSGLVALLGSIGKKAAKAKDEGDADDAPASEPSIEVAEDEEPRTAHLLYLSRQEIEAVAGFARERAEALGKVFAKKKADTKALEKLRKDLQSHLEAKTSKNAVDVGLFGRFVTSDELDTIDGALQVAHGLGTQKVEVEYDYFTAVDDLGDSSGAGHLGESELASSVLYLYACCDLGQLEQNLGARTETGRKADDEAKRLAKASLPALVNAIAQATPKGKKNGTAPHTPAEYVEVVVRRGEPLSFANAFSRPIEARAHRGDVMAGSIEAFDAHRTKVEQAYSRDEDVVARFVLCIRDSAAEIPTSARVASLKELTNKLSAALDALPRREA